MKKLFKWILIIIAIIALIVLCAVAVAAAAGATTVGGATAAGALAGGTGLTATSATVLTTLGIGTTVSLGTVAVYAAAILVAAIIVYDAALGKNKVGGAVERTIKRVAHGIRDKISRPLSNKIGRSFLPIKLLLFGFAAYGCYKLAALFKKDNKDVSRQKQAHVPAKPR